MPSPLVQAMTFQNSVNPAQTGIAPTDVVGAYKLASDVAEKNYQAQLAKQQALWGGLAGLGGAGILGFGPTIAKKLFGQGASTAAGIPSAGAASPATSAAFDPYATGVAGDLGNGAAPSFGTLAGDLGGASPATSAAFSPYATGVAGDIGAGSTVSADMGLGGAVAGDTAAGGTLAADLGGAATADAAAAGIPDWLASLLPFLVA